MEADSLIGQKVFGGYVVTRPIGAGGMGEVLLVENAELNKKLVIKVLLSERSTHPELVERFLAEARAAAAIRHRHIVEILDSSTLPDGRPYILMEYLEGETLFSFYTRQGMLPADVTLAILCQVCVGLEVAHKRGVIHRDIKPSNIFITPQPDNPYLTKILDFGIAKMEDPTLAGGVVTRSVMIAGTPHYMSPEQARTLHHVDHRTDIYALGVIGYELLTGQVPYDAHSIGELVFQQAKTAPPLAHELRSDLPDALSNVLEQALAIDPDHRPSSARDLAMMLIAATPDGMHIAREFAPLLFARAQSTSVPGVRGAGPRSHVSEIHSRGPRPRRVSPTRPSPDRADSVASSNKNRRTELLLDPVDTKPPDIPAEPLARNMSTAPGLPRANGDFDERARTEPRSFAPEPHELVTDRIPKFPQSAGTNPPIIYNSPPVIPPNVLGGQVTGYTGEPPRPNNMRWLLVGLVLAAAIGAAIAIGLFTGPGT